MKTYHMRVTSAEDSAGDIPVVRIMTICEQTWEAAVRNLRLRFPCAEVDLIKEEDGNTRNLTVSVAE